MLLRPVSILALVGAACAFVSNSSAQIAPTSAASPTQGHEVRAWLLRIHEAASHRNFQGTFVVSGGGAVSSARIAHFAEGKNEYERSESLDGQARYVYRHNSVVHTLWPGSRIALVEQRAVQSSFPALLQAGEDRIVDFYDVHSQGIERVAGHEANLLLVKPKDNLRYGYRLWADRSSGLLLRADVLGEHNEIVESSAFSDVAIDVSPQPESVLQPMKRLEGYRILRPVLIPTQLETEGWAMSSLVPGFRQVSCVQRPMDGTGIVDKTVVEQPVLQTIYSDGLTYVSVFIEPFNPQRHTRQLVTSVGATQTLMRQHGDWWVTIVGDVPASTLRQFSKKLERKK